MRIIQDAKHPKKRGGVLNFVKIIPVRENK
jgi:hypothetical protein